jgi:excisionase family DNA binding protein
VSITSTGHHEKRALTKADRPSMPPLVVSPEQAAQLLGLSLSFVYVLMRDGTLQNYKFGRSRRITMESIRAYIERRLIENAKWEGRRPSKRVAASQQPNIEMK